MMNTQTKYYVEARYETSGTIVSFYGVYIEK